MDDSFSVEYWHNDFFWLDAPISVPVPASTSAPARQISAFVPYLTRPATGLGQENNPTTSAAAATVTTTSSSYNSRNVNKRMVEYWRKHWHEKKEPTSLGDFEREKCHRHMLNERMRREKQKQSYLALHSMLPKNTKNDKNSIIQSATRTIQEMKALEKTLKRRNLELEMAIARKKKEKEKGTTPIINVALSNPSCGINSMLAVLNFLKTVGVNSKAIHATFFNSQFSAQLAIDTHMGAAEVERALQVTLDEAERKFQRQCKEGSKEIKETHFNFNNSRGTHHVGPEFES
ncbi:transcription factor bHLH92 [Benincasa hispida]|uniref:transcription factor bHLH92 n=1 Tax=Benincasa hispida TaxID=102211 RepID=UPI0019024B4D|nr:transcription factor bHLH92 [Benincasa hispida]